MRGKHRHAAVPSPPPPPEDCSWAARAEGLKRERPAQLAMVFALFAFMVMLAGWVAVLITPGGNIRFNPVFWLLAAPLMVWLWNLQCYRAWAVDTLWFVLAPCLALLALFVAPAGCCGRPSPRLGLGIVCSIAALAGLWAWPTMLTLKLGFDSFMVPLALAAAWCGRAALRGLPQAGLEP